ncbi:MAG: hypothetical protein ABL923_06685 [Burkholderiaceae bacterium]
MTLQTHSPADSDGMPIYQDEHARDIVDSLEEGQNSSDWYPSNAASLKLWHCLEALRDIEVALGSALNQKSITKRKRQMKMFSVQLVSFATAVVQLCDTLVGDKNASQWLKDGTTKEITKVKQGFLSVIPLEPKGDLSILRNKLGAHIDKSIQPSEAGEILSRATLSNLGKWLHICLHVLLDLIKLDIYSWSLRSNLDGCIRLMTNEPYIVTFRMESDGPKSIVALHLSQKSPKMTIVSVVENVIRDSQWIFEAGQTRIRSLKLDKQAAWNTFTKGEAVWFDPQIDTRTENA